ncbi:Pol [Symbiodinium sp. CCMP2592]|nr:Pol [Symbiodinium sp. CCMP2592]
MQLVTSLCPPDELYANATFREEDVDAMKLQLKGLCIEEFQKSKHVLVAECPRRVHLLTRRLFELNGSSSRFKYFPSLTSEAVLQTVSVIPGLDESLQPAKLFPPRCWRMASVSAPNKKRTKPDDRRPVVDRSCWPTSRLDAAAARALDWASANHLPTHTHLDLQRADAAVPLVEAFNSSGPASQVYKLGAHLVSCFSNLPHVLIRAAWCFYRASLAGKIGGFTARYKRHGGPTVPHVHAPGWRPGMVSLTLADMDTIIHHHLRNGWFGFGDLVGLEVEGLPMGSSLANALARMTLIYCDVAFHAAVYPGLCPQPSLRGRLRSVTIQSMDVMLLELRFMDDYICFWKTDRGATRSQLDMISGVLRHAVRSRYPLPIEEDEGSVFIGLEFSLGAEGTVSLFPSWLVLSAYDRQEVQLPYMNYESWLPVAVKRALLQGAIARVEQFTVPQSARPWALQRFISLLKVNSFPDHLLDKWLKEAAHGHRRPILNATEDSSAWATAFLVNLFGGSPLTTLQEAQALQDYFRGLYRSSSPESLPPGQTFPPFELDELTTAIAQLPTGKALPSWLAPAPLWALAATEVATTIHPVLSQWLANMSAPMPGRWPQSSLCLLAKPTKPPKCPENLRPIALLHPVSKCLAKMAAELLRPTVQHLATCLPQFAYIGGRSVEDSIERACSHCAAVRAVLEAQKYSIHRRRQGHTVGKCKGGITLSLDLSRAFDCLPRDVLHRALTWAAVEPALIDLILHIHYQATLNITHKSHTVEVELHSGVRQGCSLSPALWSIFICYTLHLLSDRIPLSCLTAFSDDILAQWQVHQPENILCILKDIAFIIDTLTSLGMSVSDSKTVILDGLRGPAKSRLLRPYLQRSKDKGPCLRVPCLAGPLDLPFRKQHPYLGIVLSYDCFEKLSLQARIKQSWANFSRLFSLLRSKHIVPQQRLQLWTACVFSTLRYGLTSTGLPPRGPDIIRQVVAKQIRLVLKSPSWITHEKTAALYARFHFLDPVDQMAAQMQSRHSRPSLSIEAFDTPERQRWRSALPASFAPDPRTDRLSHTQSPEEMSRCGLVDVSGVIARTYTCPHCPQTFPTLIALRTHCTKSHGKPAPDIPSSVDPEPPSASILHTTSVRREAAAPPAAVVSTPSPAIPPSQKELRARFMQFAKDGMPHCLLCDRQFAAWPPFLNHHYTNSCPAQAHDGSLVKDPAAPAASSSVLVAESVPDATPQTSDLVPPVGVDTPPPVEVPSHQLPLLQRSDIRTLACQEDWQPLAHYLRSLHSAHGLRHCPVCHQWFTRTQDIFRHLKRQHPLPALQESMRADWLTARLSTLSPALFYNKPSLCASSFAMSLASSLALGSGLSLQETQQREAQAELLLLQCWGEDKKAMVQDTANKRSEMDQTEEPERERDAKYSRPDSKGGYGRGGRGKGNQPKANGPRRQPFRRSAETEAGAPEGMMWLLGKLLLRHEDQMGIDKTQNSFVMFFKRESALSLIPLFVQKSQHWNALKEQKQEKMDEIALPLRTFLFHTLLEALVKRIKDTVQNDEQLKTATTLQVFLPRDGDAELQVPFLSYNQETKTLAPRQDLQPLPVSTMLEKLQVLQKQCLCPLAIMRFHSTQRLSGPLQGPTVPFLLQVGHRSPEAAELYLSLRSLANSAIWQLVGGSLRPEKMGRSALATELARRLQGRMSLIFGLFSNGPSCIPDGFVIPDLLLGRWQNRSKLRLESLPSNVHCEYQLIAIIMHEGPVAASGHYRALLCTYPPESEPTFWLCDDSKEPTTLTELPLPALTTGYLYFYCRTQQSQQS